MKEFAHECDHDEITEMAEYWERQAHEAGECEGEPSCGYCLDEARSRRNTVEQEDD